MELVVLGSLLVISVYISLWQQRRVLGITGNFN